MQAKPLELFTLKFRPRRLLDDESTLWEKICPFCKHQSLIYLWNWQEKKYTTSRCMMPDCKYGNK